MSAGCQGWVKLWRKALENPDLVAFDALGLWARLLMLANHEPGVDPTKRWAGHLERGQAAVVMSDLAAKGGMTPKRLRVLMAKFRAEGMLGWGEAKGKAGTVLTICNFDDYQSLPEAEGKAGGKGRAKGGAKVGANSIRREEGKEGKKESPDGDSYGVSADGPSGDEPVPPTAEDVVAVWNEELGDRLPRVAKLTPHRRAAAGKRLREDFGNDLGQVREFCRRVARSPFLTGENREGWRADFDFAMTPDGCARIVEGKYDPRPSRAGGFARPGGPDPDKDRLRAIEDSCSRQAKDTLDKRGLDRRDDEYWREHAKLKHQLIQARTGAAHATVQ